MTDSDIPERLPPMRWLVSGLVTVSLICGAIAAVGVLFFADGLFDVGKDPAVSEAQMQRFESRMAALEKRVDQAPAPNAFLENEMTELQKKIDSVSNAAQQSTAGQIVLALTQIKDAFEHDQPIRPGLELLQKTVTDKDILASVDQLSSLVADNFPTKAGLVAEAQSLVSAPIKPASLDQGDSSWSGKLKGLMGQFVQIQPLDSGATYEGGPSLINALSQDNLPMARSLASQLPVSPGVQNLISKIDTRLRAQSLVQQLITSATRLVGHSNEGLY